MAYEADQWAKDWLEEQRAAGKTGLTVEKRGGSHIVKTQRIVRDGSGKRRKESEYLGVLSQDGRITPPKPRIDVVTVGEIRDLGTARLLAKASEGILPSLMKAFPRDYKEAIELAFARCLGRGELKDAGKCWKRMEDVLSLKPSTSPRSLSETLARIGLSRESRDAFFGAVCGGDAEMAADMSAIFSKARGVKLSKKTYDRPADEILDKFGLEKGAVLVMEKAYCRSGFLKMAGDLDALPPADPDAENARRAYRIRCILDEHFAAANSCLYADRVYMRNNEHMLGHLFVTFVSLQIWMGIADIIDKAHMSGKYSARDVLDAYSAMKSIDANGVRVEQTVPKDVRELDEELGLYLFTEPGAKEKKGGPQADPGPS